MFEKRVLHTKTRTWSPRHRLSLVRMQPHRCWEGPGLDPSLSEKHWNEQAGLSRHGIREEVSHKKKVLTYLRPRLLLVGVQQWMDARPCCAATAPREWSDHRCHQDALVTVGKRDERHSEQEKQVLTSILRSQRPRAPPAPTPSLHRPLPHPRQPLRQAG
jgi:hypothetical protein